MIWQTKEWGEMLLVSKQAERIFEIDGIQVEKRSIGLGQYGLFVLGLEKRITSAQEKKLQELCKKENILFFQIEYINYSDISKIEEKVNNKYYKKFIYHYAAVINLSQTEEEILLGMKPKGRYNIRLAEKKGVIVKRVDKIDKNVKAYYELMKETTSRDSFNGNTLQYYTDFLQYISESELLLAYKGEDLVAGGIFVFRKEAATYYYGASTSKKEFRNIMAPYLLQWEAIKIGKESASKLYDFGGVAIPGEKNHPWIGVTDFKKKFTKDIRKVSTSELYVSRKVLYSFLLFVRYIKNIIKK